MLLTFVHLHGSVVTLPLSFVVQLAYTHIIKLFVDIGAGRCIERSPGFFLRFATGHGCCCNNGEENDTVVYRAVHKMRSFGLNNNVK